MPVERREQVTRIGIVRVNGKPEELDGRDGGQQPSMGGTSRVSREAQARICERLGVKFPGPTRPGLVTGVGYDSYVRRIVFPLEGNLYGRSISAAAPPHRFLPGAKGGLYSWAQAQSYPEVILVEGLFDYAVLWQAGFRNVTCSLGT